MALLIYIVALYACLSWGEAIVVDTTVTDSSSVDLINTDSIRIIKMVSDTLPDKKQLGDSTNTDSTIQMLPLSFQVIPLDTIPTQETKAVTQEIMFIILSAEQEIVPQFAFIVNDSLTLLSDADGLVSVFLPVDSIVRVRPVDSSWSFQQEAFELKLSDEFTQFNLQLVSKSKPKAEDSADMIVVADREVIHDRKQVSMKKLYRDEMQEVAATQGDPMQIVKSLPGVTSSSDLNVRPYVRGGDERETRVFWNNIPLIQPYHALSAYSIFNMEAVDRFEFYSGGFPVEGNGSLSGAMFMESRPAPLDTMVGMVSVTPLRANFYMGVPVVTDRLGVYFSYQAFLYDWFVKRTLDVLNLTGNINDEDAEEFKSSLDLPNFKDMEFGLNFKINESHSVDYTALNGLDLFRVLDPTNPDDLGNQNNIIDIPDTLALVDIPNWIHGLNFKSVLNNKWSMQNTLAYQSQKWNINFLDNETPLGFELERTAINFRSHHLYQYNDQHLFTFGVGLDIKEQNYDVDVPKAVYEIIVKGNNDSFDAFGHFESEGLVIEKNSLFNSLSDYSSQLIMDYEGKRTQYYSSLYFGDDYKLDSKQRFELGGRLEHESHSGDLFLAPRVSYFKSLDVITELTLASGLYSQNEFDFYYQHFNNDLVSEKAWHTNFELSHDFTPHYSIEWSSYTKYYYDLASSTLRSTDEINVDLFWDAMALVTQIDAYQEREALASSLGYELWEFNDQIEDVAEQALTFLPKNQADDVTAAISKKNLNYHSRGVGYALGSEVTFKYDPNRTWRGWISLDVSVSERRDRENSNWYAFKEHRPWNIKWHNYFDMPNDFELAIKGTMSAGKAYTGFKTFPNKSDTVLVIEEKNSRRFAPYTRVDLRLSQEDTFFGYPATSYFEVWNMFNEPNYILTDSETGEFKSVEYNYPIPIFFVGYEVRF